ncbi:polysaccharide deacetylase family protein [Butyrivibrio sp. YAB3001]|uniref:polysaccharide deacetylase family protein n=1 Tax=Butyrivibrio sp. YAB3001 TaxID=1520812 RepID=UPI0008F684C1|nr:polysaccharide deacetylase family protein [Butyrivibrio sp. YAB3001]SFC87077.1 Polysaccharide deacetylase [Butyrivibrio sp. YAB3001]
MKKYAVISMDVEDWYHTYFPEKQVDRSQSLLDGLDVALDILKEKDIKGSFFVVGEIAEKLSEKLRTMDNNGHEIGCHNWEHLRPVTMPVDKFKEQLVKSKKTIEEVLGHNIEGYRAPSLGIDTERHKVVQELFGYDSSYVKPQKSHKYGTIKLDGFTELAPCIYKKGNFTEFEVSTQRIGNINLLLGGGYIRMLPWPFIKWMTRQYLASGRPYVIYMHPIDLSSKAIPRVEGESLDRYLRTHIGRKSMVKRFKAVISMLEEQGYEFVTFEELRNKELTDLEEQSVCGSQRHIVLKDLTT